MASCDSGLGSFGPELRCSDLTRRVAVDEAFTNAPPVHDADVREVVLPGADRELPLVEVALDVLPSELEHRARSGPHHEGPDPTFSGVDGSGQHPSALLLGSDAVQDLVGGGQRRTIRPG